MHVVVNHLRLREPVGEATLAACREVVRLVVDAGDLVVSYEIYEAVLQRGLRTIADLGQLIPIRSSPAAST